MQLDPADIVTMGGPLAAFYAAIESLKHFGYKKAKNGGGFSSADKASLAEIAMMVEDLKKDHDKTNDREIRQEVRMETMAENIKIQTGVMRDMPAMLAAAMRENR